jgi:hypothetical protein
MLSSASSTRAVLAPEAGPSEIYFDPSNSDTILLGNAHYEIGISKVNGAVTHILDKGVGQNVSAGSRYECLWGSVLEAEAQPDNYVGGSSYRDDNQDREFSWTWHSADHRFTLRYIANPERYTAINVWVDITLSSEAWFDMRLFLENNSGYAVERVLFPSDLMFLKADMQELLLPVMPGVVLGPGIFDGDDDYQYTIVYPGWPGVFADYQALDSAKGQLAMYAIHKPNDVVTTRLGPIEDGEHPGNFYLYRAFYAGILDGSVWDSPMVRLHVGEAYQQSLAGYRTHNHIGEFPDLRSKLGAEYDRLVSSPHIKVDTDRSISAYETLLSEIPAPAILHWVSFWPPGFDENYPDLLPPRPEFGTTAEMAALFRMASTAGFYNMPYTNPTWWDDEAPTFQELSAAEVAVRDADGIPFYECTGSEPGQSCTPENAARDSALNAPREPHEWLHGGYVVSPHVNCVKERLEQLIQQMTADIPSDLVFEDQVGARALYFDHNPSAPDPASYHQGWLSHTSAYSSSLLMTEAGYDRLAETETGFHGSYLLNQVQAESATGWWGADNWHIYPLTSFLTRDKTLFYQHNLAPETFTYDPTTLRWNLATGYMLSYSLYASQYGGGLESPWLDLVSIMQSEVLSQYADELVVDFSFVEPKVSLTAFETFSVMANWDEKNPCIVGPHMISPGGVYVSNDEDTVAGLFDAYNGEPLTNSEHLIVERRTDGAITVWHPLGADTNLRISPLGSWSDGDNVLVLACDGDDTCVTQRIATVADNAIDFEYASLVDGLDVQYYRLMTLATQLYLPLTLA